MTWHFYFLAATTVACMAADLILWFRYGSDKHHRGFALAANAVVLALCVIILTGGVRG